MRNFLEKEYDVSAVKVTRRKSHPSRKKGKQRHHSSSKTKPEVARDAVDNAKDGVENAKRDGVDNAKQDGMDNAKHDDVDNAKREDKKNDGVDDAKHDDKKHRLGARGAVKMPKAMVKKAMGTMKNAVGSLILVLQFISTERRAKRCINISRRWVTLRIRKNLI